MLWAHSDSASGSSFGRASGSTSTSAQSVLARACPERALRSTQMVAWPAKQVWVTNGWANNDPGVDWGLMELQPDSNGNYPGDTVGNFVAQSNITYNIGAPGVRSAVRQFLGHRRRRQPGSHLRWLHPLHRFLAPGSGLREEGAVEPGRLHPKVVVRGVGPSDGRTSRRGHFKSQRVGLVWTQRSSARY